MDKFSKGLEVVFDYKDVSSLKRYISEKGKITPRRIKRIGTTIRTKIFIELSPVVLHQEHGMFEDVLLRHLVDFGYM